ncbi:MAG: ABC transporter substrate-binding protein [Desulfarculaceae bacterium]|nr:ABC transporter substrate-binding protein [Desulfarculaceae bacterium]MCF8048306.1 ABC transporter substrate-binding protein [Desulfarculaceae bacterium]MCF8064626.1 ABC transporter substrate-binding protein [Desulfarculaceae bacterium]MCF8096634.1 ABC transporter substrate-binding protein [Desulfarculaceae bacterium]MCF8123683.1 ABC transporter substrate-binding protein [Desulfarculaceae bacterium]
MRLMGNLKYAAATLLVCALLLAPAGSEALTKVSLQLQWVHQAQFTGFYLAQDLGLYRKAGLEVDIRPGGPGIDPLSELATLRCDFALSWLSDALVMRSKGVDLVNLAQLVQRSALMLVVFNDSGIRNVKDLDNRKVGLWQHQFAVPPRALFTKLGIQVNEVSQNVSMAPFLQRAVDAATAMLYNEYHQLYQAGVDPDEITVFDFAEQGLNFPEDGLYTMEDTYKERPQVCKAFVQASLEGWRRAFLDQELALASVMKRVNAANLASNLAHQRWMLKSMKDLYTHRVGTVLMGQLSPYDLLQLNRVLVAQGFIPEPIEAKGFVTEAWR